MNIIQRKDIIVFGIIIIFVFLIGGNMLYRGCLDKINLIKSQIGEEKKKNDIASSISTLDKKSQVYRKRSFSTLEITQVLDKISELAKQANITIENFNPQEPVSQEQYIELPIQMAFSCHYHSLGKFLSLIESNQEFIKVKKLTVRKPTVTDVNQTKMPSIDITLCGLYLKK